MAAKNPPKWIDVYPQGTQEGNEEQRFFIALARSKWEWRSVGALAKEANLTKERVEEILKKYWPTGMVVQSSTNEDNWGYWERVGATPIDVSITDQDQNERIDDSLPCKKSEAKPIDNLIDTMKP